MPTYIYLLVYLRVQAIVLDNDHLVIDGVNGYLHPIGDVTGLTTSLCKLLDSVELRNQMGVRSNQNLRENYSMEIFEKRYLDLIEGK